MRYLLFLLPLVTLGQTQVRVNVGGGAFTDLAGNNWAADTQCSSSLTFNRGSAIANTVDPTLYLTGRTDPVAVSCSLTVTNNTFFFVTLRFAETDPAITRTGQRIFNVIINGALVRASLDVRSVTLAANTALDLSFGPIPISNSSITVTLATVGGSGPILQAISAISASSGGDSTWTNFGSYIGNNTGGGVHVASSDFGAYGGSIYNPSGFTQMQFLQGSAQSTQPFIIFYGSVAGTSGTVNRDGGTEYSYSNKRKQFSSANLHGFASDVCSIWSNKDDLADVTQVYDSQICRNSSGKQLDILDDSSQPAVLKASKFIASGAGVEGVCDATQRGRIVFVTGAAGVTDTLRVCRKDAADVYAWTALY